jgi:hypothetical protein
VLIQGQWQPLGEEETVTGERVTAG